MIVKIFKRLIKLKLYTYSYSEGEKGYSLNLSIRKIAPKEIIWAKNMSFRDRRLMKKIIARLNERENYEKERNLRQYSTRSEPVETDKQSTKH